MDEVDSTDEVLRGLDVEITEELLLLDDEDERVKEPVLEDDFDTLDEGPE